MDQVVHSKLACLLPGKGFSDVIAREIDKLKETLLSSFAETFPERPGLPPLLVASCSSSSELQHVSSFQDSWTEPTHY